MSEYATALEELEEFEFEPVEAPDWQRESSVAVNPADFQDPDYKDLRNMVHLCLHHMLHVDPTPLQYEIVQEIQNGPQYQIICGFRGLSKSWLTAFYVVWLLYWYPKENILVLSAGKDRAAQFTHMVLGLLREIPELQWLYPTKDQRQSGLTFDVAPAGITQSPSVKAAGIFTAITGFRAGIAVGDDIEIPENSDTVGKRMKLVSKMEEVGNAILKPDQKDPLPYTIPRPRVVLLGTPQSEESVYTTLEKENGYEFTIWPIQVPDLEDQEFFGERLAPSIRRRIRKEGQKCVGQPVDPWRFPMEVIENRRARSSRLFWKLQFALSTRLTDAERYPLRTKDLIVMDLDPFVAPQRLVWSGHPEHTIEDLPVYGLKGDSWQRPQMVAEDKWLEYTNGVLVIDPSGRGKDETSYCVLKVLNGNIYLLEQGGYLEGYEDSTLEELAKTAALYRVNTVLYENNFGDGMFGRLITPFLRKHHPCEVQEVRAHIQKEKRIIDALEGPLRLHRLVVNRTCIEADADAGRNAISDEPHTYRLFYQLTHIRQERDCIPHDDRLDALATGVKYLADMLHQDDDESHREWKQAEFEDEMAEVGLELLRPVSASSRKGKPPAPAGEKWNSPTNGPRRQGMGFAGQSRRRR